MEPISFESEDNFGVKVMPAVAFTDNSIGAYLSTLDSATHEAVIRNQDKLKTRNDVEKFVHSLRG